jgi:cytochrome c-type biogenesis protein CcmF
MVTLGAAALVLSLVAALAAGTLALAGTRGDRRYRDSSRRAVYGLCALLSICVAVLEAAFLRSDFSVELVAEHSSTTTPTFYKLTAMWSSQGGSLLLWAWLLSIVASIVLFLTRRRHRDVIPWATAVLAGLAAFFCGLMLLGANPFTRLDPAPVEGMGLNPLLRHPMMAAHPIALYSGYVFFAIPFAFAIGALITRRLDAAWIHSTRRFALVAWALLGLGLIFGSRWSYMELGWGGYWGWDPVENAALMPWLMGTAFLHSIMVQERRGMLKVWNVSLIVATFALALLGTFLVRSGVLQSIHAFGASTVGGPLLALIAVVILGSTLLIVSRLDDLGSERRIDSLLSREAVFLVNNLLLVGLVGVIAWGTFFPLISEAVTGETSSLAAPWFNRYVTPIGLMLVLFTGIGPLLAWRRVSLSRAWRLFAVPAGVGLAIAAALGLATGVGTEPLALLMFALAGFSLSAVAQEFWRGALARRALVGGTFASALSGAVTRNRRRYGGYIVHTGIAILMIAIAASSSFQTSRDLRLSPGQTATVAEYEVTYTRPTQSIDPAEQRLTFGAVLDVDKNGEDFATLTPSRNYYSSPGGGGSGPVRSFFEGQPTSEVGRREEGGEDVWTAMQPDLDPLDRAIDEGDRRLAAVGESAPAGDPAVAAQLAYLQGRVIRAIADRYMSNPPAANIRFNVNPLAIWIWVGGAIALLGALLAVWPAPAARRRRVSDVYAARLARELGRA